MKPKVLIVDDESAFTNYLSRRLSLRGMSVQAVGDAETALKVLEKSPVDVMLLDICLPGMDGLEALKVLQRDRKRPKVVMLTGHGSIDLAVEGMKLGITDFLQKPCDIDSIVKAIEEATSTGTREQ